jgi:hypothetical protein
MAFLTVFLLALVTVVRTQGGDFLEDAVETIITRS